MNACYVFPQNGNKLNKEIKCKINIAHFSFSVEFIIECDHIKFTNPSREKPAILSCSSILKPSATTTKVGVEKRFANFHRL